MPPRHAAAHIGTRPRGMGPRRHAFPSDTNVPERGIADGGAGRVRRRQSGGWGRRARLEAIDGLPSWRGADRLELAALELTAEAGRPAQSAPVSGVGRCAARACGWCEPVRVGRRGSRRTERSSWTGGVSAFA